MADKLVAGEPFDKGQKSHHWAGSGVYFWEEDPDRAVEWSKRKGGVVAVIGAEIRLGSCLDLTTKAGADFLSKAEPAFIKAMMKAGSPPPQNEALPTDPAGFKTLCFLDCAIIDYACTQLEIAARYGRSMPRGFPKPIDTVRCAYEQGDAVFPGSQLRTVTHIEVAVRNLDMIVHIWREV